MDTSINKILARFSSAQTEREYRKKYFPERKKLSLIASLILLIPLTAFLLSDYHLFGTGTQFFYLLVARLIVITYVFLVVIYFLRSNNSEQFDYCVLFGWLLYNSLVFYINTTRPADYFHFVIIDVLQILFMYILIPTRVSIQLFSAMCATLGDLVILFYFKVPMSPLLLTVVLVSYGFANMVGVYSTRRMKISRRHDFINFLKERDLREEFQNLAIQKDKLFSIVSHDLKSPFLSFLSGLKILNEENYFEDETEKKEFTENLYLSAQRVYGLLDNLLGWAKVQLGKLELKPETINVKSKIDDCVNIYSEKANSKKVDLINDIAEIHKVYIDENVFCSVVRNLISNAIKFSNENGKIIVSSEEKKDYVDIRLKDMGVGIPEDKWNSIFDIYADYSTPGTQGEKGSGIGLSLCKELIEKSSGKIWFESKEGEGTTFTISLPIKNSPA